jgi:cysteine-rich repeat protein
VAALNDLEGKPCARSSQTGTTHLAFSGTGVATITCELSATCGDGIATGAEACDDGNTVSGDGCSSTCTLEAVCGNGITTPPEVCDDGNTINGDGCNNTCSGP